jgi:hypothetical protein
MNISSLTLYTIYGINKYHNFYTINNFKQVNKYYYKLCKKNNEIFNNYVNLIKRNYILSDINLNLETSIFFDKKTCIICNKYNNDILQNHYLVHTNIISLSSIKTYCRECFYRCMFMFIVNNNQYPIYAYFDALKFQSGYNPNIYINKYLAKQLPKVYFCYRYNYIYYTFWPKLINR